MPNPIIARRVLLGAPAVVAGGVSAEASQFLARTTGLDGTHTTAYTTLIDGLVADGLWSKIDWLHIYATNSSANALLNLKSSSYPASVVGTPSFTTDRGYTMGNGSNDYLTTPFIPSSAGGSFTQNSSSIGMYLRTSGTGGYNSPSMGGSGASNTHQTLLFTKNAGNDVYGRCNQSFGGSFGTNVDDKGMWIVSRTGASTLNMYKDGSAFGSTQSDASTGLTAVALWVGVANDNGSPFINVKPDQFAAAFAGAGLNATEAGNLSSRINAFLTTVGANVY